MKKLLLSAALFVLCAASAAKADTLTTYVPTPSDLNDLDHHMVYTWKIDANALKGQQVTGASITFKNIRNWNSADNKLFIHLLDNARFAGVASFVDDPNSNNTNVAMIDDFVNTRYHADPNWLVANGTADTWLNTYVNIPDTAQTLVYNFSSDQLTALFNYISNDGFFALGFDPDCHFFNDYIKLQVYTKPPANVPEPATLALLGTGLAGLYARRRRQQQRRTGSEA